MKREPEKIQACMGFEPLTSVILVQRPIDWGNKPPGSRSLNWFVLNLRKDDDEVKNIWTSYARTVGWRIISNKKVAVTDATFAVAERKPFSLLLLNTFWGHSISSHPPSYEWGKLTPTSQEQKDQMLPAQVIHKEGGHYYVEWSWYNLKIH